MLNLKGKIYRKICDWCSVKNFTWMMVLCFLLILLPVLYCSFFNRASGDDYGYGTLTRWAWLNSHSLNEVFKASYQTVRDYYYGWQGTWFSIFMFTLQPEVFSEKAYVLVAFLMLSLWIFSTFLLFGKILRDKLKYDKWSTVSITLLFLIICISFIPSKKSSIFWYNGCAHYMIPFVMCQTVAYWLIRYGESYKKRYLFGITVFMTLLGGANYQAALFAMIIAFYYVAADWFLKKDKRSLFLVIPMILEGIGLIVSMKSPGNSVRAGEGFGFSVPQVIETVLMSFAAGIKDIYSYFLKYPMIFVGLLVMFVIMLGAVRLRRDEANIKFPGLIILAMYCLYSAMQAPAIYAGVDVSGGVYNTNFQVFMMMAVLFLNILAEKAGMWMKNNRNVIWDEMHKRIVVPGLLVCVLLAVVCRSDVKETTTWMCVDFIASGQAADYREQMDQLTKLMTDESVEDIVVPFINDVQGPLMHMPVTEDKTAWTNTVICQYYGKKSAVAIPRPEWEEKYQQCYEEEKKGR